MTSAHFKDVARTIAGAMDDAGITYDVYMLLNLSDNLISMGFDATEPVEYVPDYSTHEGRIEAAFQSHEVMDMMVQQKKIHAIKALRALTLCGLKEAKDAVESPRITQEVARLSSLRVDLLDDPWNQRDEPPF